MPIFLLITHLEPKGILYMTIYIVSLMGMGARQENANLQREEYTRFYSTTPVTQRSPKMV